MVLIIFYKMFAYFHQDIQRFFRFMAIEMMHIANPEEDRSNIGMMCLFRVVKCSDLLTELFLDLTFFAACKLNRAAPHEQ